MPKPTDKLTGTLGLFGILGGSKVEGGTFLPCLLGDHSDGRPCMQCLSGVCWLHLQQNCPVNTFKTKTVVKLHLRSGSVFTD